MSCDQNQPSLSDESLQSLHDSQEMLRVVAERIRKHFFASSLPIFERYAEGRLSLVFNMDPEGHWDIPRRMLTGTWGETVAGNHSLLLRFDAANRCIKDDWNQQPMFISDVQSVYGPNGVVSSIVGLYLVKHPLKQIPGGLAYSVPAKRNFKCIAGRVDGKFSELTDGTGSELGNDFHPSIVEGAFEIVNHIPSNKGDLLNSIPVRDVVFDDFVSKLRINLDTANVTLFQQFDPGFQPGDMLLGPIDLETGTLKCGHSSSI
jgi:hypothetical protein